MINIPEMSNRLLHTIVVDTEVILVQIYNILPLAIVNGEWDRNKTCRDAEDFAVPTSSTR